MVGGANGDALSVLLEHKFRELTARIEPSIDFDMVRSMILNTTFLEGEKHLRLQLIS